MVTTAHEVAGALRQALKLCIVLSNQRNITKNSYCVRAALLQHLFTRVIPLPLPLDHPEREMQCFWASRPIRYETQADILRLLHGLTQQYAAAALSLRVSRSFDATRIFTMACIATIADVVVRRTACDIPSDFSMHYGGAAAGPSAPFRFEVGRFAKLSEQLCFTSPALATARTLVMDYHDALARIVPAADRGRIIFQFDRSMDVGASAAESGDYRIMEQLCLQLGFPRAGGAPGGDPAAAAQRQLQLAQYLAGVSPALVACFPMLPLFRDIVFNFKALTVPSGAALPPIRRWLPEDAQLHWSVTPATPKAPARLLVYGFGTPLDAACLGDAAARDAGDAAAAAKPTSIFARLFGGGGNSRSTPSAADPSNLAGEFVATEEDVLHVKVRVHLRSHVFTYVTCAHLSSLSSLVVLVAHICVLTSLCCLLTSFLAPSSHYTCCHPDHPGRLARRDAGAARRGATDHIPHRAVPAHPADDVLLYIRRKRAHSRARFAQAPGGT